jgi:hypothetical protein
MIRMYVAGIFITALAVFMDHMINKYVPDPSENSNLVNTGVILSEDASAIISWVSEHESPSPLLVYDTLSRDSGHEYAFNVNEVAALLIPGKRSDSHVDSSRKYYYQVRINDLYPFTRYYFRIICQNNLSEEYSFFYYP